MRIEVEADSSGTNKAGSDRIPRTEVNESSRSYFLHLFLLIGLALLLAFSWFHFVRQSGLLG